MKPYTAEVSFDHLAIPSGSRPILYAVDPSGHWRRLGGTIDDVAIARGGRRLSLVSVTPRVFSALGSYATSNAAISFTLGDPARVTVRVFNRAGRLVRTVAADQPVSAGANLVRWDGRGDGGRVTEDGLYLIAVDALGVRRTNTVAIIK